jgi:hypothetical protein
VRDPRFGQSCNAQLALGRSQLFGADGMNLGEPLQFVDVPGFKVDSDLVERHGRIVGKPHL